MFKTFIGVDPGQSGGIAVISKQGVEAFKMPQTEKDIAELFQRIAFSPEPVAYLEKVHAMPKQGVSSTFKFGVGYGGLRMALTCSGIRFEDVTPARWQKKLGCLTKGDKNITKQKAQQLFPEIKVTHALADALLIAEYGRQIERDG